MNRLSTLVEDQKIIESYLKGKTPKEIAAELNLPNTWRVYRAISRNKETLEKENIPEHEADEVFVISKKINKIWNNMNRRCNDPKANGYKYYGGKGIEVKMKRQDILALWKRDNAHLLKKPSIDRIDSNGHYSLENCRFIEMVDNTIRARRKK